MKMGMDIFSDEDCDDSNPSIHPDTQEICDGMDNNCNNLSDEDVTETFYVDSDGDGFGNPNISTQNFVTYRVDIPPMVVIVMIHKNEFSWGRRISDNLDNDCNDEIDDGIGQLFYVDEDNDGFGDSDRQKKHVTYVWDYRVSMEIVMIQMLLCHLQSTEVCDGIDNNCNDEIDEDTLHTFYRDFDEDSFGNPNESIASCEIGKDTWITIKTVMI